MHPAFINRNPECLTVRSFSLFRITPSYPDGEKKVAMINQLIKWIRSMNNRCVIHEAKSITKCLFHKRQFITTHREKWFFKCWSPEQHRWCPLLGKFENGHLNPLFQIHRKVYQAISTFYIGIWMVWTRYLWYSSGPHQKMLQMRVAYHICDHINDFCICGRHKMN